MVPGFSSIDLAREVTVVVVVVVATCIRVYICKHRRYPRM